MSDEGSIKSLGYHGETVELIRQAKTEGHEIARVIAENRERYVVHSSSGIYNAEITGTLRYSAASRLDFPAVGDWVKVTAMDGDNCIIIGILPRSSILHRKSISKPGDIQLIATNIDHAFITQPVDHSFNLNRVERYLTICNSSSIKPVVLLTKSDIVDNEELDRLVRITIERTNGVPVFPVSILVEESFTRLESLLESCMTYCFLGSSGTGKSTIVNRLMGRDIIRTGALSTATGKGRHTTSRRELFILPNGSLVIDTPGMREIGMADNSEGIELTYDSITELAGRCRFNDCSHINESGCAVLDALEDGKLSAEAYENYQKLVREEAHYSSSVREKRQKSRDQGKYFKRVKEAIKKNKL